MIVPESNRIYLESNTTHKKLPIGTKHSACTIASEPFKRTDAKGIFYECICDCGTLTTVSTVRFKFRTTSCGCINRLRICKTCGKNSNEIAFPSANGSYCVECKPKKRKTYRTEHLEALRKSEQDSYKRHIYTNRLKNRNYYHNGGKEKQDARLSASPESFLKSRYQLMKYRPSKLLVTADDLIKLWYQQDGKCAISGLDMLHQPKSLYSASVDRIRSAGDYTIDNIQLVCRCMNLARREHPTEEMIGFLEDYHQLRLKGIQIL